MRNFVAKFALVITLLTAPLQATFAAGETGHSDLVEMIAMYFGLNPNAAALMSTLNQGLDVVPGAKAAISGVSSDKGHFSHVKTELDMDVTKLDSEGKRGYLKALVDYMVADMLGGNVGVIGDPESHEFFNKGLKIQNPWARAIALGGGAHTALDLAGFHNGYKGAVPLPLPYIGRFIQIPLGHLVAGTTPDRLSVRKVLNAMRALGPQFILIRESQRESLGVNQEWLDTLTARGVDVNNLESMIEHFLRQPGVEQELLEIDAQKNPKFLKMVIHEMRIRLIETSSFKNKEQLLARMKTADAGIAAGDDPAIILYDLIEKAWGAGELNEGQLLKTVFANARSNATQLNDLVNPLNLDLMSEELKARYVEDPAPEMYTRDWVVWTIVERLGRNLIKTPYSHMDVRYLSKPTQKRLQDLERESITRMQKALFGEDAVKFRFVANPAVKWMKTMIINMKASAKANVGQPMLIKMIAMSDAVLSTVISSEYRLKGMTAGTVLHYFYVYSKYLIKEGFRNPLTSAGNFDFLFDSDRRELIKEIRKIHTDGLIQLEVIDAYEKYLQRINDKYNTAHLPIGVIQKTAAGVKVGAEYLLKVTGGKPPSSGGGSCRQAHLKK